VQQRFHAAIVLSWAGVLLDAVGKRSKAKALKTTSVFGPTIPVNQLYLARALAMS
jgi:hypothetical protein